MNTVVQQREKQSRNIAWIGTVAFHVLILLALTLLVLMPPDPPLGGGQGMTMSLGEEDLGGPSPEPVVDPQQTPPQPETKIEEDPVATQQIEDAPEVVEKKVEVKKKPEVVKPVESKPIVPVEQPRKVDERALFKKKNSNATASGYGDGNAPGNEGRADGDPKGNPDGNGKGDGTGSGSGNGSGNGIGDGSGDGMGNYELHGRSIYHRPVIEDKSKETGKVVVQIVVDRNGRVIRATPGYKGSTSLNPTLLDKAKQGALEAKFSAKPDGPEEQYGTITFIFKFKQ
jgi:outer membrane biosynthesis protein TonB